MEYCTHWKCSSVICYTVDGMLHIQVMFVCYMIHSWWNVAQLMECCTYRQCSSFICYTVDGMLRICSSVICYTVDDGIQGMLHCYTATYRQCSSVICYTVDVAMLHTQAMFVCYMLHSWWNVAHTGNVMDGMLHMQAMFRLLYATQLMECCTYRQCVCYTLHSWMLHIKAIFVCYMLHSWWDVKHTGNVRLLYATQLMECCTYRQCSSVIRYTVDGMLHIKAIFVCYMLHSWWNVAHTGNVRLLYATQLRDCCTYRQCSSVIWNTVDGMLHIQAMLVCHMLHSWWMLNIQAMFVCYMLHS